MAQSPEQRRAAREARAQRAGFKSYGAFEYAQRKAKAERLGYAKGYTEARPARKAAEAGDTSQLRPGDKPGGTSRKQIHKLPGRGEIVTTTPGGGRLDVVERHIMRATKTGTRVKVIVDTASHKGINLFARSGIAAAALRTLIDQHGGLAGAIAHAIAEGYGSGPLGDGIAGEPLLHVQAVIVR